MTNPVKFAIMAKNYGKERIMKLRLLLPGLLLAALLAGCGGGGSQPTAAPDILPTPGATEPAAVDYRLVYGQARSAVEQAGNLLLSYRITTGWTAGDSTVTDQVEGTASIANVGSEDMTAIVEETLSYGTYRESYAKGVSFVRAGNSFFRGNSTGEDFLERQVSPILLDEALYGEVTGREENDGLVISFAKPTGAEAWPGISGDLTLTDAWGEVLLDASGSLVQSDFQARYRLEDMEYSLHYTVKVSTPKALDLEGLQKDFFDNCPNLTDIRAPKEMLKAVGSLFSANRIAASLAEEIKNDALDFGYRKDQSVSLTQTDSLQARVSTDVALNDYRGEYSHTTREEAFADGVYSVKLGDAWQKDPNITAGEMRRYCEDLVLSGLLATKYLTDATAVSGDGTVTLTLKGSEAFMEDIMAQIKSLLNVDLSVQAQQVQTKAAEGYLVIDQVTGLPLEAGIRFLRQYTIDNVPYELSYSLRVEISLLSE